MSIFYIVDGNSIANRAFYGVPPLTTKEGIATNAVYGFINMLKKLIADAEDPYLAVAFDERGKVFRHAQYEAYKANRKGMPALNHTGRAKRPNQRSPSQTNRAADKSP